MSTSSLHVRSNVIQQNRQNVDYRLGVGCAYSLAYSIVSGISKLIAEMTHIDNNVDSNGGNEENRNDYSSTL